MGVSYQKGWVRLRGAKWHGNFRRTELDPVTEETKLVTHSFVLGLKSEMNKFQAREKLESEIAKTGGRVLGEETPTNGAATLGWFVKNRYLPLKEGDWREETGKVKKYLIQAKFVDHFADSRLENFDKIILQKHLNRLGKTEAKDTVLQMRAYMRDIFAEAVDQDFLPKDPARKLKTPAVLRPVDKTTLTWEQLRAALRKLSNMSLRDWILVKLDMSNALRPSELFPLRWRCFLEEEKNLDIQETLYKGKIRPFGKTKRSTGIVPLADVLVAEIVEYREELKKKGKDVSPDAFMFAGRDGGFIDPGNYRRRVLYKLKEAVDLPKLTFQVIRRTIATLAKGKGHPKDIQSLMRHDRIATTMEIYMQTDEPGVRRTINSIHDELGVEKTGKKSEKGRKISVEKGQKGGERREVRRGIRRLRTRFPANAGKMRARDLGQFR